MRTQHLKPLAKWLLVILIGAATSTSLFAALVLFVAVLRTPRGDEDSPSIRIITIVSNQETGEVIRTPVVQESVRQGLSADVPPALALLIAIAAVLIGFALIIRIAQPVRNLRQWSEDQ